MLIRAFMDHLIRDIRYAARLMVRKSGYSSCAVLTLALGIGASAAMFTRSIARDTALLVGVGGALGLVGAAALSRVVSWSV